MADIDTWPDWPLTTEAMPLLARYVDDGAAGRLVPANAVGPWDHLGVDRIRSVYEALRARRIAYATEPWNVTPQDDDGCRYQRIRGPEETARGPATCLDLALLFAGMCLRAGLRPLVAVSERGSDPHACVLVDDLVPLGAAPPVARVLGDVVAEDVRRTAANLEDWSLGRWTVVDVVGATAGADLSFEHMRAATELDPRYDGATWLLVDVATIRGRAGFTAYVEPPEQSRAPIHTYLPVMPAFRDYASRTDLVRRLLEGISGPGHAPQVLLIQAEQGLGKSLLARRLAGAADHNAGWFLPANDRRTLIASLADAERKERAVPGPAMGDRGEKPDANENESLAAVALARLRDTLAPWVVVLDNCDHDPRNAKHGIGNLLPVPRHVGQTLIVTTTDPAWLDFAASIGAQAEPLPPLEAGDLVDLGLPPEVAVATAGRPLIAEGLARLLGRRPPEPAVLAAATDGPALMWDLFRAGAVEDETRVARTLAWCPPEGVPTDAVPGEGAAGAGVCEALADVGLVIPYGAGVTRTVVMHRLVATAVRADTWEHAASEAAAAVERVVLDPSGRRLLLETTGEEALVRLEDDEVPRVVANDLARRPGWLWHAVGHIRERRGPVPRSADHFEKALDLLSPTEDTERLAECLVGIARKWYQSPSKDVRALRDAAEKAVRANELLASFADGESGQLREQANALRLLIDQKIVGEERDAARRLSSYLAIRDGLWASYDERRRIAHVAANDVATFDVTREAPTAAEGLGCERAFYNLAGVNLQIAKTAYEIDPADPVVDEAFGESARVYDATARLREARYGGRAHPHLAACVQGLAYVLYYRALYGRPDADLATTLRISNDALAMRMTVAVGLYGDPSLLIHDPDVGKATRFVLKVAFAGTAAAEAATGKNGRVAALRLVAEAMEEYDRGPLAATGPGAGR